MRRTAWTAAVLSACWVSVASAQDFDGVWLVEEQQQTGIVRYRLTLSGPEFTLLSSISDGMGFFYQSRQVGRVELPAPDRLRLVVVDWEPKVFQGYEVPAPEPHALRIVAFNGRNLTVMSESCATQAPADLCTSTYRRID